MSDGGSDGPWCLLASLFPSCACQQRASFDKQDVADADSGAVAYVAGAEPPACALVESLPAGPDATTRSLPGDVETCFPSSGSKGSKGAEGLSTGSEGPAAAHEADQAAGEPPPLPPAYRSEGSHHSGEKGRGAGRTEKLKSNLSTASFVSNWSNELESVACQVTIDDTFDLYDPTTKKVKVMQMADVHQDVLHEREKRSWPDLRFWRRGSTPNSEANSSERNSGEYHSGASSERSGEASDAGSDYGCSPRLGINESPRNEATPRNRGETPRSDMGESLSSTPRSGKRSPRDEAAFANMRSKSFFDEDNVTNWGTVVAKLLRRRVHGITETIQKSINIRRNSLRMAGPVFYILPSVRGRAQRVVEQARALAKRVTNEAVDQFDSAWDDQETITRLLGEDYVDNILLLANTVRKLASSQPMLAEAVAPCRVFGDIHGQLRDLLILLRAFGAPGDRKGEDHPTVSFVFNGDFVDRGRHSLEVVGLLFALKVLHPQNVWLVRGNHEDKAMNDRYGFLAECLDRLGKSFGQKAYDLIHRAFDELPIGCVISEKVLVVHGGIGEGKFTLNDMRAVERPLTGKGLLSNPMVWNVLWSDPIEDDEEHGSDQGVFGVHASPRSLNTAGLFKFGWNVTKTFCAANGLGLIIRSHQSKEGSLGFSVMHDKMLVRVFSARDYEEHGNDAAVVLVSPKEDSKPLGPLVVRPQVLRALTKVKEEDKRNKPRTKKKRLTVSPTLRRK